MKLLLGAALLFTMNIPNAFSNSNLEELADLQIAKAKASLSQTKVANAIACVMTSRASDAEYNMLANLSACNPLLGTSSDIMKNSYRILVYKKVYAILKSAETSARSENNKIFSVDDLPIIQKSLEKVTKLLGVLKVRI